MNSSIEFHHCFFSQIGCPSRGKLCPNHQSLLQQTGLNLCLSTLKDCLSRTCCCLELSSPFPGLRSQLGCRSARPIQLFEVTPVPLGKPQLWPPASEADSPCLPSGPGPFSRWLQNQLNPSRGKERKKEKTDCRECLQLKKGSLSNTAAPEKFYLYSYFQALH